MHGGISVCTTPLPPAYLYPVSLNSPNPNSSFLWLAEALSSVAIFFFFDISDTASSGYLPSSETPIQIPLNSGGKEEK